MAESISANSVGPELVVHMHQRQRDLCAPRSRIDCAAQRRLEEQPELHVAVLVGLTSGERAIHQRRVEPLIGQTQLANPPDQRLVCHYASTPASPNGALSAADP